MTASSRNIAALSEDPLVVAAAEWFERLHNEELDAETLAAWQQWLAASPDHKRAFDGYLQMWERMDGVPRPTVPAIHEVATDPYSGETSVAAWPIRNDADTRLDQQPAPPRTWAYASLWPRAAVAAALLAVVGIGAWQLWNRSAPSTAAMFETRAAENRDVRLPDGSMLSLGAESLALMHFTPERRAVVLDRGEAFFEVAKDTRRPFVVRAGETTITAIGTAFNVRKTGERVLVAVAEGVVEVEPSEGRTERNRQASQQRISAGHRFEIDTAFDVARISAVAPESAMAWRTGRREYLAEPLKYVVADVNRYSTAQVSVADAAVGELLITGTVFDNDIDGWLRSLEEFLPVKVERPEPGRVVLVERAGAER